MRARRTTGLLERDEESFTPRALLEADWEEAGLDPEDLPAIGRELHAALLDLRAHEAAILLIMGHGLARFAPGGDCSFATLGHSSRRDATWLRLGIPESQAREMVRIAGGVEDRPALRAAYLAGDLSRCKLRALLRVATPETELGWLAVSRARSVRAVELEVGRFRRGEMAASELTAAAARDREVRARQAEPAAVGLEEGWTRLRLTGTVSERALLRHQAVELVSMVAGRRMAAWEAAEAVAANALAGSDVAPKESCACDPKAHDPGPCIPLDGSDGRCAVAPPRKRRQRRALRSEELIRLGARAGLIGPPSSFQPPDPRRMSGCRAVLDVLRVLAGLREKIAYERGRLLWWMDGRNLWRALGARSLALYAEHALEMSPHDLRAALALQTRLAALPHLRGAWARGRVLGPAIRLVAPIATAATDLAWARYLERISLKRLDAEVGWHEFHLGFDGPEEYARLTDGGRPQPHLSMEDLRVDPLEALDVRRRRSRRRSNAESMADEGACAEAEPSAAAGGACGQELEPLVRDYLDTWRRVGSFSLLTPVSVVPVVRAGIEVTRLALGPAASDAACLIHAARQLVLDHVEPGMKRRELRERFDVLDRGGWQCSNVLCTSRRGLHVHHVKYRSHGGSDDPENLLGLCWRCHQLVHDGHLVITGTASEGFVQRVGDEVWREGLLEDAA